MISQRERLITILFFGIVFLVGYSLIGFLPHYTTLHASTFIDQAIPFIPACIILYFLGIVYPFAAFFLVQDEKKFQRMTKGFFIVMGVAFAFFIAVPVELDKKLTYGQGILPFITHTWHTYDTIYNNFPSLHVAFTLYGWLIVFSEHKNIAYWTSPLALSIILSVLFVKSHLIIDVVGGIVLAIAVFYWYKSGFTPKKLDRPMV